MFWTSAVVLYVVIWFLTLFVVLPIGYQSQEEEDGEVVPGTPPGAPSNTHFKRKFLWTTIAATVIWAVAFGVIVSGIIPISAIDLFSPRQ